MRRETYAYVGLALACALIVALSVQNRHLRSQYAAQIAEGTKPRVGAWLPIADADTLAGGKVTLGLPAKERQILYFFDPSCPYCEASVPAIRELGRALQRNELSHVEMLGIARPQKRVLAEYVRARDFGFPVALSTPKITTLFNVNLVPLLVVVDRDSRVVYSHVGKLDIKEELATILTALHAKDRRAAAH